MHHFRGMVKYIAGIRAIGLRHIIGHLFPFPGIFLYRKITNSHHSQVWRKRDILHPAIGTHTIGLFTGFFQQTITQCDQCIGHMHGQVQRGFKVGTIEGREPFAVGLGLALGPDLHWFLRLFQPGIDEE
ncbi:hypothetical protein D3C87_1623420 [compost metagenome]